MVKMTITQATKDLIDSLKATCATYGLGNDGNEFKIITQVFLYKFMNDKFAYEIKLAKPDLAKAGSAWEQKISKYSPEEYEMLLMQLPPDSARLKREHYLSFLHKSQNQPEFAKLFDDTLHEIAMENNDIFSVKTGESGSKIILFDRLSDFISDSTKRDDFCRALINKLYDFSFEQAFGQKYDFFATIFEYLIKDYNKDGGGKYAEYYTPHAVARIMAAILVDKPTQNVTCYDPSAGSGTLLMSLAHAIGEDRCTIYSQDISQKSSGMLRLNLILNNLVHSLQNIVQGDTLLDPYHKDDGEKLKTFDFIVSNPPFKLDFSDSRDDLASRKSNKERFFAGIPKIPNKKKESMAIYLLFIQHIMYSLNKKGKAAIVVPTGFITAQSGIEKKIRERLVEQKMLKGVVSMPSNIFATTGTNVSVLFLDRTNKDGDVILVDASTLGEKIKDGKNQKTVLTEEEEKQIIAAFKDLTPIDGFKAVVSYDAIKGKNCSFSAGQYFDIKITHEDISETEFKRKISAHRESLLRLFRESALVEAEITRHLDEISL